METARKKSVLYPMAATALMAAVTCVLAPLSIPIGPIPVTLTNLVVYFSLYALGWKWGTMSLLVYLGLGMAGMPVFSGFKSGLAALAGPTGGYIVGFVLMAVAGGLVIDHTDSRLLHIPGLILGTALCYALGTAWFCFSTGSALWAALGLCVFPFIPVDLVKILLSTAAGPAVRRQLCRAGLFPGAGPAGA